MELSPSRVTAQSSVGTSGTDEASGLLKRASPEEVLGGGETVEAKRMGSRWKVEVGRHDSRLGHEKFCGLWWYRIRPGKLVDS